MHWSAIVKAKQAARTAAFPSEWLLPEDILPTTDNVMTYVLSSGYLSKEECKIIASSATRVVDMIAAKQWTAVQVLEAFAKSACLAHQLVNPVTEVNFDAARQQAELLDIYQAKTGRTIGPLHGLPFSVKDSFQVEGTDTSMAYTSWVGRIAHVDAVIVAACRAAGGIPFIKTTCGHTLMMGETVSHLFGRTLNPFNRTLTSGGSSGGESALLALRGSPLGWGTDIGGSIRLPACSTALYGLRPSVGRVSYRGISDTFIGQEAVRSVAGPMGHDPEDLSLIFKAYLAYEPWRKDPDVLPLPWRQELMDLPEKLCFAYVDGDETVTPHPPVRRGLEYTLMRLREAGHTVIRYPHPIQAARAARLMIDFWTADGGEDVRGNVEASGEPMIKEVAELLRISPESKPLGVPQTWRNQHERNLYAQEFLDHWESTASLTGTGRPVDALICPAAPFVARPHGANLPESRFGMFECTYANFQPILHLTTGAFPTGLFQDPAIDVPDEVFLPRTDLDETVHALYTDPEEWRGAPIGLQLVGRRLEEEKVLAMLGVMRDVLATKT